MLSIDEYNNNIGKLYVENSDFFKYSPCFSRCEGISFNYAKFVGKKEILKPKYIYLIAIFLLKILRDFIFVLFTKKSNFRLISNESTIVFSYFDERSNHNGYLREEYFREILDNEKGVVCIYKFITPGFFSRGIKYTKLLENLDKSYLAYSEYSFINFILIFKAIYLTIKHFFRFLKIKENLKLEDNLKKIFVSEHFKEILSGVIYQNYLQELMFNRIFLKCPRLILYVWENQPWNKILETSKNRISPETITRGFQHTGFCKKLLQHFPSKSEIHIETNPDQIICNGIINKNELKKYFPNTEIIVGSALRQNKLFKKKNNMPHPMDYRKINNIAFAFSWDQSNYSKIILDLEEIPLDINIYLKFHPNYPDWLFKSNFQDNFINSRLPWEEISKICPLVLANDNSLMFEGYFYGMHTAIYDLNDDLKLDFRDFCSPITHLKKENLKDLNKKFIIELINKSTDKVIKEKYLEKYFVENTLKRSKEIFLNTNEIK